jgi:hypothetical protein
MEKNMKKLALIVLLAVSGLANAAYVGIDTGPVRRDLIVEDPVNEGMAMYPAMNAEPMVTPADQGYYYTPYGERSGAIYNGYNYNRPVANTVSSASNIADEAVQDVASVIPF